MGIRPTLPKLNGVEVERDGGIAVDSFLKVADGVYAAGDIARYPYGGEKIRVEHWIVAQDQGISLPSPFLANSNSGKVAAHNMLGKAVEYKAVPFFWTNQFGVGLQYLLF